MDMVIIKGDFNYSYGNDATWISFGMLYTVKNAIIEVSDWSILATFLLISLPPISSATIFNRYSYVIYSKKGIGLKFVQVKVSNFPGRGGQTPASYQIFCFLLHLW